MTIFEDFDRGQESIKLLKLYPRFFVNNDDITVDLIFPFVHTVVLDFVDVNSVSVNGEFLSPASNLNTMFGQSYFYVFETKTLHFRTTLALPADPFVVVEAVYLFSSLDIIFNLNPLNSATRDVFYDGRLISTPTLRKSLDESLSGVIPSFSSSLTISNPDSVYSFLCDASRFGISSSRLEIFLGSRPLDSTKVIKIFTGFLNSISQDDEKLDINFSDFISIFSKNIPLLSGNNSTTIESYPGVAQSNLNFNIREVSGRKNFIRCLNVDADNAVSPKNPSWVICKNIGATVEGINFTDLQVLASPAPSATRFYFSLVGASPVDPQPGDIIFRVTFGTGQSDLVVTAFNRAGGFVDYESVATIPAVGMRYRRDRIGHVYAYRNIDNVFVRQTFLSRGLDSSHTLRGVVSSNVTDRTIEVTINHDPTNILNSSEVDILVARVYGLRQPSFLAPGNQTNPFLSPLTGAFNFWHQEILRAIDRVRAGQDPTGIVDQASYIEINDDLSNQELVSYTLPYDFQSQMPTVRQHISLIVNSVAALVFTNTTGELTIAKIKPLNLATPIRITKDEIIRGSFSYDQSNTDLISNIALRWNQEDFVSLGGTNLVAAGERGQLYRQTFTEQSVRYDSESTTEKENICLLEANVIDNANKQKAIYAYPIGTINLSLPISYSNLKIGDTLRIERSVLPSSDSFILADIISINITPTAVQLILWDKKGITENLGDF